MKINNNSGVNQLMQRYWSSANAASARAIRNIASGYKINSAADNASGLAIARRMNAQITGMSTASRNTQDAVSMLQTADGILSTVGDVVGRMNELAMRAGNGILSDDERQMLQAEYDQLASEVDRIGQSSSFNGNKLFDGSTYTMQVGEEGGNTKDVTMGELSAAGLGLDKVDLTSVQSAGKAVNTIREATRIVSSQRAAIGASENGLQSLLNNLGNSEINLADSLSKIMDADIATETMNRNISDALGLTSLAMMKNSSYLAPYNTLQLLMR
ncbi:MAG: flagellin FliC [Provencibacterium sp.]|jgi:flagellin|nr:flagellin FliC [Provencibacterium sp.]